MKTGGRIGEVSTKVGASLRRNRSAIWFVGEPVSTTPQTSTWQVICKRIPLCQTSVWSA